MTNLVQLHQVSVLNLGLAARLAAAGNPVEIFKCSEQVIDLAHPCELNPLTLPAVWRDLFLKTGRDFEAIVELELVSGIELTGLKLPPIGQGAWLREIRQSLGPVAQADTQAVLNFGKQIWQSEYRSIYLSDEKTTFVDSSKSWQEFLNSAIKNADLRTVFTELISVSASSDDIRAITKPYLLATFGGWQHEKPDVFAILREHAQSLGVQIIDGCGADCPAPSLSIDSQWGYGWHFELMAAERLARLITTKPAFDSTRQ